MRRFLSTTGTKNDHLTCGICAQDDDHWPPTCPNTDLPSLVTKTAKHKLSEFQARGSNAQEEPKDNVGDLDALAQASRGTDGIIYTHWQCRICGKINKHWPRMCPYKYLFPGFVSDSDRASTTGKSSQNLYTTTFGITEFGCDVMFCGICGAKDHLPT